MTLKALGTALFLMAVLAGCDNKPKQTAASSSMDAVSKQAQELSQKAEEMSNQAQEAAQKAADEAKQMAESLNQPAADAQTAINNSKSLPNLQDQIKYLIGQAQNFLAQKKMNDVLAIGQYILSTLDPNNPEAKALLEQAQAGVSEAVSGMTNKIKAFGK